VRLETELETIKYHPRTDPIRVPGVIDGVASIVYGDFEATSVPVLFGRFDHLEQVMTARSV
jgi:hypothetical protein